MPLPAVRRLLMAQRIWGCGAHAVAPGGGRALEPSTCGHRSAATAAAAGGVRAVEIPAYSGAWLRVAAGEYVRITDVEGEQIADMFACCADDSSELLSAGATRGAAQRLFPRVGGAFFSNRFRSLLTFVADRSPGVHDMLWRPCDSHLYALAGAQLPHPSCTDNFRRLAAEFGWTPEEVPDPVDWFQNTPVGASADAADALALGHGRSPSRAGDNVVLRAEVDLNVIVTSCSWDVPGRPINGDRCTPVRLEVAADGAAFGV